MSDDEGLKKLITQRDLLAREIAALQNKVAGLETAIAILNDAAPADAGDR